MGATARLMVAVESATATLSRSATVRMPFESSLVQFRNVG